MMSRRLHDKESPAVSTAVPTHSLANADTIYFDIAVLRRLHKHFGELRTDTLLNTFAAELVLRGRQVEDAIAQTDAAALARVVHTMRGIALAFGCNGLAALCESGKFDGDMEACRDVASQLVRANRHALAELAVLRSPGGALRS
jgi:HPt (histidine-containing phosphotransfer) domain-containing protein